MPPRYTEEFKEEDGSHLKGVGLTSSWSPPPSLSVMVLVPGLVALTLVVKVSFFFCFTFT